LQLSHELLELVRPDCYHTSSEESERCRLVNRFIRVRISAVSKTRGLDRSGGLEELFSEPDWLEAPRGRVEMDSETDRFLSRDAIFPRRRI
jgi:hypothetical protein